MKVDLFTYSADLQEIIINEYPGTILEEQAHVDKSESDNSHLYCFYDLEHEELTVFLGKYKKYSYEIRESSNGDFIRVNEPEASMFEFSLN